MNELIKMANELTFKLKQRFDNIINLLISLSAGAIVLSISFLEKITIINNSNILIIFSWISLLLSIITGIFFKYSLINQDNRLRQKIIEKIIEKKNEIVLAPPNKFEDIIEYLFFIFFIVGIILLVIFAILNL